MKISCFTLLIVVVLFTACSSPINPTASLPPTPVLRPALTFVEGKAEIPPDHYLFVEKLSKNSGEIERRSYSAQHPMNIGNLYHRFA
jgi:hypothetical protein